ncbi:MAG: hypothetical protein ACP5PX_08350, partial [Candidatus Hadarchaeum sp.]|uniref:hypothetical protein n=1 Tax=Candidatus Hadarchaeum sp. TaxID=2883567 RepID=UPI003D09EED1
MPDPRVTNPELFDLTNPDAPIPQFVQALIQVGIEITPEQVRDEIRYGIFPSVDNSSLILGYYNTSGSDNTDYSLVYVFDPNTEVFSSDNSLREMARALGVWFGNNDEAWSIEF